MSSGQQIFTKTAKYQGQVVAIKFVNKAFVAISPVVVQEKSTRFVFKTKNLLYCLQYR